MLQLHMNIQLLMDLSVTKLLTMTYYKLIVLQLTMLELTMLELDMYTNKL